MYKNHLKKIFVKKVKELRIFGNNIYSNTCYIKICGLRQHTYYYTFIHRPGCYFLNYKTFKNDLSSRYYIEIESNNNTLSSTVLPTLDWYYAEASRRKSNVKNISLYTFVISTLVCSYLIYLRF